MRSCSDSIAQLASALAKAQIELVNPAKTLTAVIFPRGTVTEGRSYRYAPLSAGLEIVRKTLGKHELALIQTTHVERDSAIVLLITTLAHGSGEWVSASWPVCRTADLTNPKLMGAALTYARRYGLFTLVGLAGEDDLDAPQEVIASERDASALQMCRTESASPDAQLTPEEPERLLNSESVAGTHFNAFSAINCVASQTRAHETKEREGSTRRRRQSASVSRAPGPCAVEPLDPMRDLAAIDNPDALFRWALASQTVRNTMSPEARATIDAAFLERAHELGADREILLAFAPVSGRDSVAAGLSAQT